MLKIKLIIKRERIITGPNLPVNVELDRTSYVVFILLIDNWQQKNTIWIKIIMMKFIACLRT